MIDPRLQELLICPACHGELTFEEQAISCAMCGAQYAADGSIPHMLTGASTDGFGHDLYHAQLQGNFFERVFHGNRITTLMRLIGDELSIPARARALDVGCNTGPMVIPLRLHGYDVVGADISPADVRQAAHYLSDLDLPADRLLAADGTCLPFRDASFDLILLIDVLEHTDHPERIVAETRRLLAPGGVVIATVPWATHPYVRFTWMRKLLSSRKTIDEHPDAPFTLEMLQDLFPAGFEPVLFRLVFHWVCILGVYRLSKELAQGPAGGQARGLPLQVSGLGGHESAQGLPLQAPGLDERESVQGPAGGQARGLPLQAPGLGGHESAQGLPLQAPGLDERESVQGPAGGQARGLPLQAPGLGERESAQGQRARAAGLGE